MISCSGFPLCLSGIRILPQDQLLSASQDLQSRIRRGINDGSSVPRSVDIFDHSDRDLSVVRDDEIDSTERNALSASNYNLPVRVPLAREMADLDDRREAIRRRTVLRENGMNYRLSPRLRRLLVECIEMQRSFDDADQTGTPRKGLCAARAA